MFMATQDWRFVEYLADWLNGKFPQDSEWQDFRALAEARNKVENVVRLLRTNVAEARKAVRRDFGQVRVYWDVFAGRDESCVKTVADATTPLGYGIFLLNGVSRQDLDRLRQCRRPGCEKWFVAKDAKKGFCSQDCREVSWAEKRKTPEVRKERSAARKRQRANTSEKRGKKR
jgi:hypothetical protein